MRFFLILTAICLFSPLARAQNATVWDFSAAKVNDPKLLEFAIPYVAPGGVAANVAVEIKNRALKFTNRAGGSFGLKFNVAPFDATRFPTLELDYTRSSDTKINFFFKVNEKYYGVVFSGPARVRPGSFLLGTIPTVGARGHISIPLRDWLRRFQPKAEKLEVQEILAGNWDNEGYLVAGIGGNGPGATWSLTRFALSPASDAPPRLGTPRFEANRLIWPLQSGVLDTTKAVFSVDERPFAFDSPFLHLETGLDAQNHLSQRVVLEAGDAGLNFKNGQSIALQLAGAAQTLSWKGENHTATVPLPRLEWEGLAPLSLDFEADASGVDPQNAVVQLDGQSAASGQNSLRLYNPRTASPFDATFRPATLDAAKFPFLTFAYRHDTRLRLDFRLRWDGKEYFIRFSDGDGSKTKLGKIEDNADGKWHFATVPLLDWLRLARPDAPGFSIDNLSVSDDAWMGNARGVSWNLDDVRAAPALGEILKARATLRDVSGIAAVSYGIDQNPQSEVDTTSEGGPNLEIPLAGRTAGLYFLHLRAKNSAGNWSAAAHFPFAVNPAP